MTAVMNPGAWSEGTMAQVPVKLRTSFSTATRLVDCNDKKRAVMEENRGIHG